MKEDKEVLRAKRETKRETVRNRIVVSSFSWPDSWKARVGRGVGTQVLEDPQSDLQSDPQSANSLRSLYARARGTFKLFTCRQEVL